MKLNFCALRCGASLLMILAASFAVSHEGHHAGKQPSPQAPSALQEINESYIETVKPIFQKACFDCHSSQTNYPWYSKLPIAKQLIEHDIQKAKEHLDMTNGFPFSGHGSPSEDLEAIGEVIKDGSMPPFRYRILHDKNKLTEQDRKLISEWILKSIETLNQRKEP